MTTIGHRAAEARHSNVGPDRHARRARSARFFLEQPLAERQTLTLDKRASHHVGTVLRMRKGDTLVLFNGDGHDHVCDVLEAGRRVQVHVRERLHVLRESALDLTLLQCVSRGDRMDSTIRQSVELGVTRICPIVSRHSVKLEDSVRESRKCAHWRNIVVSAAEQSGRSVLPRLDAPVTLPDWLAQETSTEALRLVLSPEASGGLDAVPGEAASIMVLIGPESGLDTDERSMCEQHGFVAMRLGPRILRTETAGPCVLSILQARNGDLHR